MTSKMKITKSQLQQVIREALEEEMGMYDDVEMDKDKQVFPSHDPPALSTSSSSLPTGSKASSIS